MRALLDTITIVLDLYVWLLILASISSWLLAIEILNPENRCIATLSSFLHYTTAPILAPFRFIIPQPGGIDLSPMVLILIIMFIERVNMYYIYPRMP